MQLRRDKPRVPVTTFLKGAIPCAVLWGLAIPAIYYHLLPEVLMFGGTAGFAACLAGAQLADGRQRPVMPWVAGMSVMGVVALVGLVLGVVLS